MASASSTSAADKAYQGSCHCAATKFSVKAPTELIPSSCDCSICSKNGSLFIYPTKRDFVIELEGPLTEYQFGKKTLGHNVSRPHPARELWLPLHIQVNSNSRLLVLLKVWLLDHGDAREE